MNEAELLVQAAGLEKRFGSQVALAGLELSAPAGRVTGLVGPDGAGKTTFLRMCAGLLTPSAGSLRVLGLDAAREGVSIQERVGYMPQRFGLYEDLSVGENLDLYADLQAVPRATRAQRVPELLDMAGLARFTRRLAGDLSGGMKQKLGLACALIKLPQLLLLDEPTVGVDPVSRRELWAIVFRMVQREGLGVLLSTAYLDEADRCDHLYLLHEGELLDSGPPSAFHQGVRGRVLEVAPRAGTSPRDLCASLLRAPGAIDATLRAGRVRLLLAAEGGADALEAREEVAEVRLAAPEFEDAFMDRLRAPAPSGPPDAGGLPSQPEPAPARGGPSGGGPPVVVARDLVRRFGAFTAVDQVSFEVLRGEVFGLLGPNGAGKTTTFRMLCGLLAPSAGSVEVAGRDLSRAGPQARARLGYMAQRFSMYGPLSVLQNLEFFGHAYGLSPGRLRARIDEVLAEFELGERRHHAAESLPGGYKQRLAMAAALLHEPDVLFLDEPTSGVDPLARREFWARISRAASQGVTVVVTTHFMEEVEYCDRMLIQSRGRMLALGTPAEVRALAASAEDPEPTMEEAFVRLSQAAEVAAS